MGEPPLRTPQSEDRLDSWKEIAAYLKRDVRTVQRWEKREEMPVHRHLHDRIGSVYASRADLDAWMRSRNLRSGQENEDNAASPGPPGQAPRPAPLLWNWRVVLLLAVAGAMAIGAILWLRTAAISLEAADPLAPPGIFTAIEEQLGLKLESKRGPAVLVIDTSRCLRQISRVMQFRQNGISSSFTSPGAAWGQLTA